MGKIPIKIKNLLFSGNIVERLFSLVEIKFNRVIFSERPQSQVASGFDDFVQTLSRLNAELSFLLKPNSEAEETYRALQENLSDVLQKSRAPFPIYYNADKSLAVLCYALTRFIKPNVVIETGVGYGVMSALILSALEKNRKGKLISIDLHPLSDVHGNFVGMAVPEHLRSRWTLQSGSSRCLLKKIISQEKVIDLFVHDSANIFTLQKWEFSQIASALPMGGAAVFNNVSGRLLRHLLSNYQYQVLAHWQIEKPSSVTGLIFKK